MINYTPHRMKKVFGLLALAALSSLMTAQVTPKNWKIAGPVYNAGRARNMIVDQSNSAVLYVGSASSGIFKSVNSGVKWTPVNDQADVRNISYLAQGADGTIYAGTGEGFLRSGQKNKAQVGTGLYRLDQSNSTLVQVVSSSQVGTVINRVACSPVSANNMALATNSGIWVNTGSGFVQVSLAGAPTGTTISGQDVKFDSNGILYCSIGAEAGGSTAALASKVYRSTDASLTSFIAITPSSSVLTDNFYGRIELAIAPSNNNVIYASCANKYTGGNTSTLKGLFVSYNGGTDWALIAQGSSQLDPLSDGGTTASGDYSQVLLVDPSNSDRLYFGGYSFYVWQRNNNSNTNPIGDWNSFGQSFLASNQLYLHQNIHDIKFVPGSPARFYFVTDAGVFRSSDLASFLGGNINSFPSFQPFYKGMVTGQYNSVSIERYPTGEGIGVDTTGHKITPYVGFIGGTGGNGMTYFSGKDTLVTEERSYLAGEVYNTEYSKILPNAAYTSLGNGALYRSANVKVSTPGQAQINTYSGVLSKIAPTTDGFSNNTNTTTGTPFKFWENYGQTNSPDSAYFYNDTVRYQASVSTIPVLTTQTFFPFSTARPNKYALIDYVVVRTGTVQLPIDGALKDSPPYNQPGDGKTIYVTLPPTYPTPTNTTIVTANSTGASTIPVTFTLNTSSLIDNFNINFPTAPFMTKTVTQLPVNATGTAIIVPDPSVYYRVFATVYYKYAAGDVVTATDNNISTKTNTYSSVLTQSLSWRDSGNSSFTVTSTNTVAVTNPTYVLVSNSNPVPVTSSNPVFTVTPSSTTTYTVQKFGTFTVNAKAVNYSVSITPTTAVITSTNVTATSYTLLPGNVTQTAGANSFTVSPTSANPSYTILTPPATGTVPVAEIFTLTPTSFSISPSVNTTIANAPNVFVVSPTVTTTYTITQTTGTVTQQTFSTVGTTTYVLNPGAVTQVDNPTFTVNTGTTAITYTIDGISSNTLAAPNSSITFNFPFNTVTTVSVTGGVAFAKSNPIIKMRSYISARLGIIYNTVSQTNSNDAIVVCKNPLALNDPMAVVRVSQNNTPLYTDDNAGVGTTNTIIVTGKPTMLEWSKTGTELYYATASTGTPTAHNLYRVSHINTVMDLSPSSYSGKFYNDIYKYSAPINSASLNPVSPFRTTLVGTFDKPITSISVSNDSKHIALTFNSTSTGTTGTIMYANNDISKSTAASAGWVNAQGTLPSTVQVTYCSMMEKTDDKIVYVGTDNGLFYTTNITAGSVTWDNANKNITSANNALPKVQVFDIKQQTFQPWDCYNSGQIYVATNGRGIWTNGEYVPYIVGLNEYEKKTEGKNLSLYPNPTNGNATVSFSSVDGETAVLQIMDISGRIVQTEPIGTIDGQIEYTFGTQNLSSGVYIVNIKSDAAVKRVSKLVVTK
ncbi:hypothetical protein CNR22_02335 [Sphingobacteriaceae bacterium]|nr:hypothetical protein CNR22_02335 [Sphingobacteriaceae bacterium]